MEKVQEGKAVISVHKGKISKKLPVFYNPVMKLNRDLSVLLLKTVKNSKLKIADPLAGSGIRTLRFLLELPKSKIETVYVNDFKKSFPKTFKSNLRLNKIKLSKKIILSNQDANLFLLTNKVFDYIDIDPFGCPNRFLDSTIKKIHHNGIIAITATDTSALCGTYENACKRKYWATPLRNHMMHEIGLRILIRKVQLIAVQYDKALQPILSYSKDHYMRIFFECNKGKKKADQIISQHKFFNKDIGPLWSGPLSDTELLKDMIKNSRDSEIIQFLTLLKSEQEVDVIGFYDIHAFAKKHKLGNLIKKRELLFLIKKKGYKAAETHFSGFGIKSDISEKELLKLIKSKKK